MTYDHLHNVPRDNSDHLKCLQERTSEVKCLERVNDEKSLEIGKSTATISVVSTKPNICITCFGEFSFRDK